MVMVRKKKRRIVQPEPEARAPVRNGMFTIARTIKRSEMPVGRVPGQRNPEYEKLMRRLIKLELVEEGVVIPVASKSQKIKIRESIRKPLRQRGYDLKAITAYDEELGEVLMLSVTKRESEEPEEEEDDEE